jgi:hypothetical protein
MGLISFSELGSNTSVIEEPVMYKALFQFFSINSSLENEKKIEENEPFFYVLKNFAEDYNKSTTTSKGEIFEEIEAFLMVMLLNYHQSENKNLSEFFLFKNIKPEFEIDKYKFDINRVVLKDISEEIINDEKNF